MDRETLANLLMQKPQREMQGSLSALGEAMLPDYLKQPPLQDMPTTPGKVPPNQIDWGMVQSFGLGDLATSIPGGVTKAAIPFLGSLFRRAARPAEEAGATLAQTLKTAGPFYHGTSAGPFEQFDLSVARKPSERAAFFTRDQAEAAGYAGDGGRVMAADLPFGDFDVLRINKDFIDQFGGRYVQEALEMARKQHKPVVEFNLSDGRQTYAVVDPTKIQLRRQPK